MTLETESTIVDNAYFPIFTPLMNIGHAGLGKLVLL